MKQFGSSKAECVPDEQENRLNQIAQMHKNGYKSVIGTRVVKDFWQNSSDCWKTGPYFDQ